MAVRPRVGVHVSGALPRSRISARFGRKPSSPPPNPCLEARELGGVCLVIHRVRDRVTVATQECDVERLVVVPMVTLQRKSSPTPRTTPRSFDHLELLGESRRIAGGTGPNASRPRYVGTNFEVATQTGDLGVLTVLTNLLHDTSPRSRSWKRLPATRVESSRSLAESKLEHPDLSLFH